MAEARGLSASGSAEQIALLPFIHGLRVSAALGIGLEHGHKKSDGPTSRLQFILIKLMDLVTALSEGQGGPSG